MKSRILKFLKRFKKLYPVAYFYLQQESGLHEFCSIRITQKRIEMTNTSEADPNKKHRKILFYHDQSESARLLFEMIISQFKSFGWSLKGGFNFINVTNKQGLQYDDFLSVASMIHEIKMNRSQSNFLVVYNPTDIVPFLYKQKYPDTILVTFVDKINLQFKNIEKFSDAILIDAKLCVNVLEKKTFSHQNLIKIKDTKEIAPTIYHLAHIFQKVTNQYLFLYGNREQLQAFCREENFDEDIIVLKGDTQPIQNKNLTSAEIIYNFLKHAQAVAISARISLQYQNFYEQSIIDNDYTHLLFKLITDGKRMRVVGEGCK